MPGSNISFSAILWRRENGSQSGNRRFVTVPDNLSVEIRKLSASLEQKPGGSVPVEVIVGFMKWKTSFFFDLRTQRYMIPIKSEIRKKLHLQEGDEMYLICTIVT